MTEQPADDATSRYFRDGADWKVVERSEHHLAAEPTTWTTALGDVVTVWETAPGDWRWHVTAGNGEVVEQGEGHTRREDAVRAARRYHPPAGATS